MSSPTKPPFIPHQSIHWILDWDGTITRDDTLDALVNIAASNKPDFPTLEHWKRITQAYLDDYTTTLESLASDRALPKTVEGERALSNALKSVEQRSLDRVSESGIFKGLTREQIDRGAKKAIESRQVELREGLPAFLQHIHSGDTSSRDSVSILSVNWSRRFISACLRTAGVELNPDRIHANELGGIHEGTPSNGHVSPGDDTKIISSADKLRWLERLRQVSLETSHSVYIVYVGDSCTDMECLLAADLGICIRDDPTSSSQKKLAVALEELSMRCPHLADWTECDNDEGKIVWARSFTDIQQWATGKTEPL